jgi:hypothetical protein
VSEDQDPSGPLHRGIPHVYCFTLRQEGGAHSLTVSINDMRECVLRAFKRLPREGALRWEAVCDSEVRADVSIRDAGELRAHLRTWLSGFLTLPEVDAILGPPAETVPIPNCS